MNTPDGAPEGGDFVAYLAELERRQMASHRPPAAAGELPRYAATEAAGVTTAVVRKAADTAKAVPVGLAIIGFAFLVAGLAADRGIILVLFGAFLLWQAVRAGMRRATGERRAKGEAAGRVAALLAAHAQRNQSRRPR